MESSSVIDGVLPSFEASIWILNRICAWQAPRSLRASVSTLGRRFFVTVPGTAGVMLCLFPVFALLREIFALDAMHSSEVDCLNPWSDL